MINSKRELKEYIAADNSWAKIKSIKWSFIRFVTCNPYYQINKYLLFLRKQEYYINTANGSKIKGFLSIFYEMKKNKLGNELGFEIPPNCFGKGLNVYHIGSIIINPKVRAGENCSLHGNNCIGNNGISDDCPRLGDNIDVGFGAVVIGDVSIASNIKIGANSFVNKSFLEKNITIAGVPAIRKKTHE